MSTPNRLESVRKEALSLPDTERASLARELVASLDGPADVDAARAWDIELCRRINEIEAGNASLLDADDVLARVRKRASGN
jgi:putative addiction module component (TIGR02574 family)